MTTRISDQDALDQLCINTIRTLSIDAVERATCGHPGAPMALAPAAFALWTEIMRFNPKNPQWFDRDRFVLSNGHASMLLYSMLHLTGYDLPLEEIKNFRQWGSKTAGHPENYETPGVETTTGPLGQGIMNAVGMAMAEAHMAAVYNRPGHEIVDHYTYVFCGDGDLMEGASHEAASLAGHLGLARLIMLYDDNHISIEGDTNLAYSDDPKMRFESYGWHVLDLGEKANDVKAITEAFESAKMETDKPSLIILRTHIGYGSPNKQDTAGAHGAALGADEVVLTKRAYGWPEDDKFLLPDKVLNQMRSAVARGQQHENEWQNRMQSYATAHPELADGFHSALAGDLPQGWESVLPSFRPSDGALATRSASAKVINAFAETLPWVMGGSADLAPSNNSLINSSGYFAKGNYQNRNIAWGVREHAMCACCSGMALHGGIRPYAATFFIFTDYARPAIRLAALMGLPVIYIMTHDSILLGEDGPTHQPVEHLASLRAMPNLCVIRPADANEVSYAWKAALLSKGRPTILALSRQKLPILDRTDLAAADGVMRGAYILAKEKGSAPDVILIASGSEVSLTVQAGAKLQELDVDARVVSMPSWELFADQSEAYQKEVFPADVKTRLAVETGSAFGWRQWIGDAGDVMGIDRFGASAPANVLLEKFGFSVENIVERARKLAT